MPSERRAADIRKFSLFGRNRDNVSAADLFSSLKNRRASLPNNQDRVAQLLLDEPHWFVRASVSEIAARLQVSAPTIVRFARKAGYEGLRDLKLQLAGAMAVRESNAVVPAPAPDGADDVIRNLASGLTNVLANWRTKISRAALHKAADAIQRARQIMCFGADPFSNLLAQKLHGELYQFGFAAHSLADANYQLAAASTLTKEDVLIFISPSGHEPAMLNAIKLAKMRGVFVTAITGDGTHLAGKGDIVLAIDASNHPGALQGVDASLLQTITVETLIMLVCLRQGDRVPPAPLSHAVNPTLSVMHES
jgi:RpiR family transcriptional regulator, carbohydrate utilization regulator